MTKLTVNICIRTRGRSDRNMSFDFFTNWGSHWDKSLSFFWARALGELSRHKRRSRHLGLRRLSILQPSWLAQDDDIHPPVLRAPVLRSIARDRVELGVSGCGEQFG